MIVHDFITAPAVVVGGGIAGLSTALGLDSCVVVANEPIGGGSSACAQGGVAAAIASGDTADLHAADTLAVAGGLADREIAALVAASACERVDWLGTLGVRFDRVRSGALELGLEAGHSRHRVVHAGGDRTGAAVMQCLRAAVLARSGIRVLEPFDLIDIVTTGNRVAGVLLAGPDGMRLAVLTPHVVLATGGIGACFDRTTNPATSGGAGLAAAARQGVLLADLEFVQFHPTALALDADPLPLLTEALRGAGAVLIDDAGERFMKSIHPHAELAPRDVVARSVHALRASGRQVFLDATCVPQIQVRFPGAIKLARAAGLDPAAQPLPVAAAAHFHMGGIATDKHGATSLTGLWACGEVASTGLHGANRLASNSLLEGLVFGERIARSIRNSRLKSPPGALAVPRRPGAIEGTARSLGLRQLVGRSLGPLRSGPDMAKAMQQLEDLAPTVAGRRRLHCRCARTAARGACSPRITRCAPALRLPRIRKRCCDTQLPARAGCIARNARANPESRRLMPPIAALERAVVAALAEDLAATGDITTEAVVPAGTRMKAEIRSRQAGRIAGSDCISIALSKLPETATSILLMRDGADVGPGEIVAQLSGSARTLLTAERTILNLLCRLSGIASTTASAVRLIAGTQAVIKDTRKTTPGLRALEKYAVAVGGGVNHRFGLHDAVLVKDNHIAIAGSITAAVERVRAGYGERMRIQVEVDSLDQLEEALDCRVSAVLLDNLPIPELRAAVGRVAGRCHTEASGGITLANVREVAETGVEAISMGSLTHSAVALDLGLDIAAPQSM